ncbi:hypothetical protein J2W25_004207 [Variovorax boronicumulans]|uniref:Uncharacterized protein n=1 Tax=Variovorax boronicumulans TaxID=436515 RepID=A0AAW8E0W7_9BURK|nr:hypothetical protein [Variovorax boronicumulans]MDP9880112.1 hypothetical protein [Variovorax boronicumulans]MDP9925164.1 hypothetical protein [Variovorax boronicumulans]
MGTARVLSRGSVAAFVVAALLAAAGCGSARETQQIPVTAFRNYGASPLQHTFYIGSDARFHRFQWSNGKQGGTWLIARAEMDIVNEKSIDDPRAARAGYFLSRRDDGRWMAH